MLAAMLPLLLFTGDNIGSGLVGGTALGVLIAAALFALALRRR